MTTTADTVDLHRPLLLRDVGDAWTLAIGVSCIQCIMVAAIAMSYVEDVLTLAGAQVGADQGHENSRVAGAPANSACAAERLALDQRGTECQVLGEAVGRITTPLRRELVLVSSVIC